MRKVLIIAEAGVNHNGSMVLAKKLVDAAAVAGADFVKFQTFKADKLASRTASKSKYKRTNTGNSENQVTMLRRLELSPSDHNKIIAHCKKKRIKFLSTPFDLDSVDLLKSFGMDLFKIPSGEITNMPFLRYIGHLKKKVILSTGMADMGEIRKAIEILTKAGTPKKNITVLHCHTAYPTDMQDVNLLAMQTIAREFGVDVGYSDHTLGIEVPVAAVALGASVIEKHFTLNKKLPGPDHVASLEPSELVAMVSAIRNVEKALGSTVKKATPSEKNNMIAARKSIVAALSIKKGEIFTERSEEHTSELQSQR